MMQINLSIVAIIVFGMLFIAFLLYLIGKNKRIFYEPMEGSEFEEYCVHILEERGFEDINQTPLSRDFGCDILAKKDGVSYGIQCKSYSTPVGVSAVEQVYAGKDYYGCMVGVVMTNSTYTAPAKEMADKLKIILWDGEEIEREI